MTQSSATSSTEDPGRLTQALAGVSPDWGRIGDSVRGPLLTLAAAVVLDVLRRQGMGLDSPFPILLLCVIYSAYAGGILPALVSITITILNGLHFFAQPGLPLHYTPSNAASLLSVAVVALLAGLITARLRERVREAESLELTADEAEALNRRFSLLEQAARALTGVRDVQATLRDLARLLVPSLADWCTIHLASEDGTLRFVAGAHRDPARDFVVRALAGYGDRALPFEDVVAPHQATEMSDDLLRSAAADEEELKLYHALAPASVLRVPFIARDQVAGMLTLVLARSSGRRFLPGDVALAEELVQSGALGIEAGRLRHEAHEADRRWRLVFDAHPQPMWIFDTDSLAFLAVNDAAVHQYGYTRDEFLDMTILDLLPPDDMPPAILDEPRPGTLRGEAALAHHRRRDGTLVDMEIVSHELELDGRHARLVLATDITDRNRARVALHHSEEQLRNAQRAEALGRIAGGVAHDFNNLLTTIRGFGEMLLLEMVPDDRRRNDVERICQAADRGALLTRQLLSFGRTQAQTPRPVDLNEVVRGMEPIVQRLLGADVALDVRLGADLGRVRIDPAQLDHVIVNLVLNARDAMPAGGRLTIETSVRRISELSRDRPVRPGRYVVLTVGDTGPAIPEEAGSDGQGPTAPSAGLGRSIVIGIVRQHGGVVRVATEPGEGTTVKIYLPRLEPEAEEAVAPARADAPPRGSETVLVAEDEDGVRELLRKALTEFGYTVLTARHGRDALMLAGDSARDIDLLVTDVVMPEMSGRELAQTLRDRRPDLKVLYVSGYTDDEVLNRGVNGSDATFMRKPFVAEDLVRRVRTLLDEAAA
jgi:PAS domain S-box-containing protein